MIDQTDAQARARTFVLVHGAWHGGWCWRRVADRLEGHGHKVFAPTLTGLGERSHLLTRDIKLATHIADIVNLIKWERLADIVLVGHSYGGTIISAVADEMPDRIASLVFLDSFVPDSGMSLAEGAAQAVRDAIAAAQANGELTLKPIPAAFFRVNEPDRAWVDAMCTPHPLATFTDKVTLTGARDRVRNKTYIRGTGYPQPVFDRNLAAKKADPSWRTYEVPCGHDVMVDMPERLSEILLEVA